MCLEDVQAVEIRRDGEVRDGSGSVVGQITWNIAWPRDFEGQWERGASSAFDDLRDEVDALEDENSKLAEAAADARAKIARAIEDHKMSKVVAGLLGEALEALEA